MLAALIYPLTFQSELSVPTSLQPLCRKQTNLRSAFHTLYESHYTTFHVLADNRFKVADTFEIATSKVSHFTKTL